MVFDTSRHIKLFYRILYIRHIKLFYRERNCRSFDDLVLSVRLFEQKMTPDYCRRYINHLKVVLKAIIEKNGNWSDH